MRNEILRQLQAEYTLRQEQNAAADAARLENALRICPDLQQLMDARVELIRGGIRRIIAGGGAAEADIPARMEELNRSIRRTLTAHGLPENTLEPTFRCPLCRDTGYVGEPVREMCSCLRSRYQTALFREVGLNEAEDQSFESFREDILPEGRQKAGTIAIRRFCENWCARYPEDVPHTLLLMGYSGLGKTFMLHAMAKRLLEKGHDVLLISAGRYLDAYRAASFEGQSERLDALMNTELLMLDDLGCEPLYDNVTVTALYRLIDERQSRGLGTVISTNLTDEELKRRYTERITSRLMDVRRCQTITFEGDDLRRRVAP